MLGLHAIAPLRRVPRRFRRGDPRRPVIVLVPGVYETWAFLEPIAERLNRLGYRIAVVRGLGYNVLPILRTAELLERALRRSATPRAGRIILAHSKGGLIGKQLLVADDGDLGVRGVIAIASPFAGSRAAAFLLDPHLRAFRPGDATIRGLARAARVNERIMSIYGPYDPHVPEGSALPGGINRPVPTSGHFRILRSPDTLLAVVDALERIDALGRGPAPLAGPAGAPAAGPGSAPRDTRTA